MASNSRMSLFYLLCPGKFVSRIATKTYIPTENFFKSKYTGEELPRKSKNDKMQKKTACKHFVTSSAFH